MLERLRVAGERYDAGETTSDLTVIASWAQCSRALALGSIGLDPLRAALARL